MATDTSPEKRAQKEGPLQIASSLRSRKHTPKMPLALLVANFYIVFRFGPYVSWSAAVTDAALSGFLLTHSAGGERTAHYHVPGTNPARALTIPAQLTGQAANDQTVTVSEQDPQQRR